MTSYLIVKLEHQGNDYYMEWSQVCDAPAGKGMELNPFTEYCKREHTPELLAILPERMARVERIGTSSINGTTAEELVAGNRAGPDETSLSKDELIRQYCL